VGVDVRTVTIRQRDGVVNDGDLVVPDGASGIVVFAHGSGSSRRSPRNRMVAERLNGRHLATLLFDLLTEDEERVDARTGHLRFDIDFLSSRLDGATAWVREDAAASALPLAYFGASTGAAAALVSAARRPDSIGAIVSRGGRPDLAGDALGGVRAPTLLLVGGRDPEVFELNRRAAARLTAEHRIDVVPGATHLFEEPGAIEEVARRAGEWFVEHLPGSATGVPWG
jgi:putative phosphoribosyl transferase